MDFKSRRSCLRRCSRVGGQQVGSVGVGEPFRLIDGQLRRSSVPSEPTRSFVGAEHGRPQGCFHGRSLKLRPRSGVARLATPLPEIRERATWRSRAGYNGLTSDSGAFQGFDLGLHSEAHRVEDEVQLRHRRDAEDAFRFVAPAWEQLALIAEGRFHGITFRCGCGPGHEKWPGKIWDLRITIYEAPRRPPAKRLVNRES